MISIGEMSDLTHEMSEPYLRYCLRRTQLQRRLRHDRRRLIAPETQQVHHGSRRCRRDGVHAWSDDEGGADEGEGEGEREGGG